MPGLVAGLNRPEAALSVSCRCCKLAHCGFAASPNLHGLLLSCAQTIALLVVPVAQQHPFGTCVDVCRPGACLGNEDGAHLDPGWQLTWVHAALARVLGGGRGGEDRHERRLEEGPRRRPVQSA